MANYLAMNRDELTAEKAALEAKYKEFQAKGLKLNMARQARPSPDGSGHGPAEDE